ncbi:MAG: GntP family permease [Bacteroidota bacterium]
MELLILTIVIIVIVVATVKFHVHPVFSLTVAGIVCGLCFGLTPKVVMTTLSDGFGKTLSGIGLVIAFGTIIGTFLEKTHGTTVLANSILKGVGLKRSPLALNLSGLVISIPVYCDSGFVILSSLNRALSKRSGVKMAVFAIALATGLYSAHVFVPPTPGPLAAAAILEADLGLVMLFGLVIAVFVSVAGYAWARIIGPKITLEACDEESETSLTLSEEEVVLPNLLQTLLPIVLPLVLIALRSIAEYPSHPFGEGVLASIASFLGNPIMALFIGVLLCFILLGKGRSKAKQAWVSESLKQAGSIVLITGAGGAFGAILRTLDFESLLNIGTVSGAEGLLLAFGIAAVLKTAQGSSTVAIITTAAIVAPLLSTFALESTVDKALAVLAIGAGAMTVSHVNDSYFWVVAEFSKMDMKTALRGHTVATLIQGFVGIAMVVLFYFII